MKLPYYAHDAVSTELGVLARGLFTADHLYNLGRHKVGCEKLKDYVTTLCDNDVTIIDECHHALTAYEEVYERLDSYISKLAYCAKCFEMKPGNNFVVDGNGKIVKPKQRHASAQ